MNTEHGLKQFDSWLEDESDYAALVMQQWLKPIEGDKAVIFPPTYAKPEGTKDEDWLGYNIDGQGENSVCQIDSIGSQANRMEPIFKREKYKHLVPQITIKATTEGRERRIDLLDAGHRGADAIVRFSELGSELHEAFRLARDEGNVEPLARIAPTSIVFGSWDSRATQAKLPRIIRSVIRAYKVRVLHRSAQYGTIAGEIIESGEIEVTKKGPKAELGVAHVPAAWTHGGILVSGEIRRDAILKIATIRSLSGQDKDTTLKLRRYITGLALVCFTAPQESFLREGCELVPDLEQEAKWALVKHDGTRECYKISHEQALAYANEAARNFDVRQRENPAIFNAAILREVMALNENDRKTLMKQGTITKERIEGLKTESKPKRAAK